MTLPDWVDTFDMWTDEAYHVDPFPKLAELRSAIDAAGRAELLVVIAMQLPSGLKLRLGGKGLPKPGGDAGDLYAVLSIAVPGTLTEREKTLYEELRQASRFNPRARFG